MSLLAEKRYHNGGYKGRKDQESDEESFVCQQEHDDLAVFELSSSSDRGMGSGFGSGLDGNHCENRDNSNNKISNSNNNNNGDSDDEVIVLEDVDSPASKKSDADCDCDVVVIDPHSGDLGPKRKKVGKGARASSAEKQGFPRDPPARPKDPVQRRKDRDAFDAFDDTKTRNGDCGSRKESEGRNASEPICIDVDDDDDDDDDENGDCNDSEIVGETNDGGVAKSKSKSKSTTNDKTTGRTNVRGPATARTASAAAFKGGEKKEASPAKSRKRSRSVLEGKKPRGREDFPNDANRPQQPPQPQPQRTRAISPKSVLYHYYEKAPRRVKLNSNQWITWEHHHGNSYGNWHGAKEPPNGHRDRDRDRGEQQQNQPTRSFTSIFVCPMSGEAFLAGPQYAFGRQIILSNQHQYQHRQQRVGNPGSWHGSETNRLHWYGSRFMAENAAAARAWDCFLLREGGNLNDFRLGGGDGGGDSGGPPPYPRGKRPAWPPSQQFPSWVQKLVRCTRERSSGKPKPATHHSGQNIGSSSRERAAVAATADPTATASATAAATATASAGNSPDTARNEFGSSASLTTRSSTNRDTRGGASNAKDRDERMTTEESAFAATADHDEATLPATPHAKATDSTGGPDVTKSTGDDNDDDDHEGTSRVGAAVATVVPRKSCGTNPNKNSTSGESDKNVLEGPTRKKSSATSSESTACKKYKPRASLTGIASSSSTATDDDPKQYEMVETTEIPNSAETMGLPIAANEKIGTEMYPKQFETPSGSFVEEKPSTLSTDEPRSESVAKDDDGAHEGNNKTLRQRICSDRPHPNMVQNRTPELGDESNDGGVVDDKEGDSPLVSPNESTTELESESKKRKHADDGCDDDSEDDGEDDVPLILLKEKRARRKDRAVPEQEETGNSGLRDASSNGKKTRSEAVHSESKTPSPNQFSSKVRMAEKAFDADDADESMGNSVIDLISVSSPVSDEGEEYASNVKKNEEKIDSFLQAVYGFSADYAPSKKQHSVNDPDSDMDVVECIEIDIDDGPSENAHKPNDRSIDLAVPGNKRTTKPNGKAKAKPRFKPHKRTKKNEKEATATRERQKILSPETNESSDNNKSRSKYGSSADNPTKDSHEFQTNYGGRFKNPQSKSHATKQYSSLHENRFIFHPSNNRTKPEDNYKNKFLGMDVEDALKEQERLFQRSAARVRTQATFRVTSAVSNESTNAPYSRTFPSLVRDVHVAFTDHWKYRDPYARLGLPKHASEQLIKSQYRRLARVYHPDRNLGKPDTKHKFQAVTEAYNSLINNTN